VRRFTFKGGDTLSWMVQRHGAIATIFGLAALAVWFLLRRRGGDRRALRPLTVMIGMLAFQGVLGIVQYSLKLPAGLVWVHVASATLTWMTVLWTVASAGRLEPRRAPAPERSPVLTSAG
jgi:cytochrome c oxidase assembly protein subunit 15